MITIELPHLTAENALTEATGTIENICEEYSLQDHFGTISLAVTEMLTQVFKYTQNTDSEIDINFYINKKDIVAEFNSDIDLGNIRIEFSNEDTACDEVFTIMKLTDNITFSDCGNIRMEFAVQPQLASHRHEYAHQSVTSHIF